MIIFYSTHYMSTKVQLNRHHKPQHPRNELEEAQCIQMLQDSGNILCACRATRKKAKIWQNRWTRDMRSHCQQK